MNLQTMISMIPEDTQDEALRSIETITTFPAENRARIRCILSREFRLFVEVLSDGIAITAECRKPVMCTRDGFIAALRRTIYAIDEALAEGSYTQSNPQMTVIMDDRPALPKDMDIPVWDEKAGKWYDAEY